MPEGFDILDGLRVVDISQYVPGPYASLLLADLGAEVIKVEQPGGDPMRALNRSEGETESAVYRALNAGKSVIQLDLKTDGGRETLARLLETADILIQSFRPGVLAGLGFGQERLAELNTGLIHVEISGWGQSGPYSDRAGHDVTYMALGGGLDLSGTQSPVMAFPPTSDYAAGQQAVLAVLAGVVKRLRGQAAGGLRFDVSIMETVLAWQVHGFSERASLAGDTGMTPGRRDLLLNGGAACYQIYRTRDGRHIALGALERKFWTAFCAAMERPDWMSRQWEAMPQKNLIDEVGAVFRTRTLDDWRHSFSLTDCCLEPIWQPEEVVEHPQIRARGLMHTGDGGEIQCLLPILIDGRTAARRLPLRETTAEAILGTATAGVPA